MAIGKYMDSTSISNPIIYQENGVSTRIPKCARCRNHGVDCQLKGHKEKCEFKDCTCRSCLVVVERQKITAARVAHLRQQRKFAERSGIPGKEYSDYNPLTEEEEYVLSSHLRRKTIGSSARNYDSNRSSSEKRYVYHGSWGPEYSYIRPISPKATDYHRRQSPPAHSIESIGSHSYVSKKIHQDYHRLIDSHPTYRYAPYKRYYYYSDDRKAPSPKLTKYSYSHSYSQASQEESVSINKEQIPTTTTKHATTRSIPEALRLKSSPIRDVAQSDEFFGPNETKTKISVMDKFRTSPEENKEHKGILQQPIKPQNGEIQSVNFQHKDISTKADDEKLDVISIESSSYKEDASTIVYSESKKLEVLLVMFPEIKTSTLRSLLVDFRHDIQEAVEYLLRRKHIIRKNYYYKPCYQKDCACSDTSRYGSHREDMPTNISQVLHTNKNTIVSQDYRKVHESDEKCRIWEKNRHSPEETRTNMQQKYSPGKEYPVRNYNAVQTYRNVEENTEEHDKKRRYDHNDESNCKKARPDDTIIRFTSSEDSTAKHDHILRFSTYDKNLAKMSDQIHHTFSPIRNKHLIQTSTNDPIVNPIGTQGDTDNEEEVTISKHAPHNETNHLELTSPKTKQQSTTNNSPSTEK